MQEWTADPAQAAALGRRGHALALRELDWGTHVRIFLEVLDEAARGRG